MNKNKIGFKSDKNKLRWSLFQFQELEDVLKVLEYGCIKYSKDNWQLVPNAKERYFNAVMRHLIAWHNGERKDKESNLSHLSHAACGIHFLQWFDRRNSNV